MLNAFGPPGWTRASASAEDLPDARARDEAQISDDPCEPVLVDPAHVDVVPPRLQQRHPVTGAAESADGEVEAANLGEIRVVDVPRVDEHELVVVEPELRA